MAEAALSFEQRIKLKRNSGVDDFSSRQKVLERKEAASKHKQSTGKVANKKMPREAFSKLPVPVVKRVNQGEQKKSLY